MSGTPDHPTQEPDHAAADFGYYTQVFGRNPDRYREIMQLLHREIAEHFVNIARACTGGQLETICQMYRGARDDRMTPEERAKFVDKIPVLKRLYESAAAA